MSRVRTSDRGFTIVEVIVAALVVTIVFAGAIYFMVGAGKSQQRTLVRQRMAASADGIVQKVRTDRTWVTNACKTTGCSLTDRRFQPKSGGSKGPDMTAAVNVSPVDSDGDGRGLSDEDGVRPDFYRIQVRIELKPGEAEEWGEQKPFETVSTVDATALGVATGTLVVQTGETSNQVDDRMAISSVVSAGDRADMRKQVEPCSSPFPITFADWASRRPILPLGCNDAFNAANAKNDYLTQVDLRAVTNVDFTIQRINSDGVSSATRRRSDADGGGPSANGIYTFSGLPAGSYRITVNPPRGRETWDTKMVPSDGKTSVQANQKANALVMVRPIQGTGEYKVQFTRQVYIYRLTTRVEENIDTFTQSGATIQVVTTYVYLEANAPSRHRWAGPPWNGLISMEPKPYDRYRANGTGVGAAAQNTLFVPWDNTNLFTVPSSHPNKDGWWTFEDLPTGLHSSPRQQEAPTAVPSNMVGMFGRFDADDSDFGWPGRRDQTCVSSLTPGGSCGNFAWMSHLPGSIGKPNSAIRYYSPDGECYIVSNVAGAIIPFRLQNGAARGERCDRDLIYRNMQTGVVTRIPDFLPDKNGNGGGQMVLSMSQVSTCIAGCGITPGASSTGGSVSPEPTSSGARPSVTPRGSTPPTPPQPAPPVNITTVISSPGGGTTTQNQTIGAAPAVAMPSK